MAGRSRLIRLVTMGGDVVIAPQLEGRKLTGRRALRHSPRTAGPPGYGVASSRQVGVPSVEMIVRCGTPLPK